VVRYGRLRASSADHRRVIGAPILLHRQHIMLRIKALGGWAVTRPDGRRETIPAQRVTLVALLVTAGARGVARDKAASLLWPDASDENARHSLGQALYALRRDAASADMVLGTTTLCLNPEVVSCDAWELETAARADDVARVAGLYAGPFLDGVRLRGSAELEHLVDAERARIATLYAQAVESLARRGAAEGNAQAATAWWRRLAAAEPLSSRVALELVRSLVDSGDRTAALDAVRIHETLVREELEAEPDPAFSAFADSLRRDTVSSPRERPQRRRGESLEGPTTGSAAPGFVPATPNVVTAASRVRQVPRLTWMTIAAVASMAGIAGASRYFRTPASLDAKRVYVSWFENRSGDPALAPIGGMARDWVSQGLEQSGVVAVASAARAEDVSRPRQTPAGDMEEPAAEAARLGAGAMVSGAYYRIANVMRFHVEISDIARGEVLDAFDVTGAATGDPTAVLETVRQRAVGSLASFVDPRLASWVRVASKPSTYDAYREFVAGQSIWGVDRRQALVHFLQAAELDSTFHAARVEAAILHRLLGDCGRTEAIARELGAVRERLAPYDYHALDEQVAQCEGDWERAYRQARALVELRPGSAFLDYSLALQAMQLGRFGEAKALLGRHALGRGVAEVGPNYALVSAQLASVSGDRERGLNVIHWLRARDPGFGPAWAMEVTFLARAGRAEATGRFVDSMLATPLEPRAAIVNGLRRAAASFSACGDTAVARRLSTNALAVLDGMPSARVGRQRLDRAQVLYELGRLGEAEASLREIVAGDSVNVDARGYLGLIAALRRDTAAARTTETWLEAARSPYVFTRTMYRARIAALLGDRERALALLGPALDEQNRFLVPGVREYAEFAALRSDARFARLLSLQ
jgi:DNA-binding SARP family transcriptional activator/tetratricopeptide (TPR) repeat protein